MVRKRKISCIHWLNWMAILKFKTENFYFDDLILRNLWSISVVFRELNRSLQQKNIFEKGKLSLAVDPYNKGFLHDFF